MVLVLLGGVVRHSEKAHRASRHLLQVQGKKAADRSRANPKERLQYLAAITAGAATTQGAECGTVTDRAAGIVNACHHRPVLVFIKPINRHFAPRGDTCFYSYSHTFISTVPIIPPILFAKHELLYHFHQYENTGH